MEFLTLAYVAFAGMVGLSAYWMHSRSRMGIISYAIVLLIGYSAMVETLGRPKPAVFELRKGDLNIVAFVLDEPNAIHVLTTRKGKPRLYSLPWSLEEAIKLRKMKRPMLNFDGTPFGVRTPHDPPPRNLAPK